MMLQDQPIPARLVVAARVSRSGQPRAAAGDLEGFSPPVGRDASGVTVTVDQVRP
jgi:cytochrome c-type biogenesis protein CcmH